MGGLAHISEKAVKIKAPRETSLTDKQQGDEVMDEILTYNNEDLEATWAVLQWLKSKNA